MRKEIHYNNQLPIRGDRFSDWARVATEPGCAALYEGRMFKSFFGGTSANNATLWLRFVTDVDVRLIHQGLQLTAGAATLSAWAGGTPGGVWTPGLVTPSNASNRLRRQPYYVSTTTVANGGTVTGGIEVDRIVVNAGTGSSAGSEESDNVAASLAGPGAYYLKLTAGAQGATYLYKTVWEEIPEVTGWEAFPV